MRQEPRGAGFGGRGGAFRREGDPFGNAWGTPGARSPFGRRPPSSQGPPDRPRIERDRDRGEEQERDRERRDEDVPADIRRPRPDRPPHPPEAPDAPRIRIEREERREEDRREEVREPERDEPREGDEREVPGDEEADRRRAGPLEGTVLSKREDANRRRTFLEISLGSDDGVGVGHDLQVYRNQNGRTLLGRAEVVHVIPDRSVGVITEQQEDRRIERGDAVTTKLAPGADREHPAPADNRPDNRDR